MKTAETSRRKHFLLVGVGPAAGFGVGTAVRRRRMVDGTGVGRCAGAVEGAGVSTVVGEAEGPGDDPADGTWVGSMAGEVDGAGVGALVGRKEGFDVGAGSCMQKQQVNTTWSSWKYTPLTHPRTTQRARTDSLRTWIGDGAIARSCVALAAEVATGPTTRIVTNTRIRGVAAQLVLHLPTAQPSAGETRSTRYIVHSVAANGIHLFQTHRPGQTDRQTEKIISTACLIPK